MFAFDMADLMRQHAEDHLGVAAGHADQLVGDHKRAVWQGEGIGANEAAVAEVELVARGAARREARDLVEAIADLFLLGVGELARGQHGLVERGHGA